MRRNEDLITNFLNDFILEKGTKKVKIIVPSGKTARLPNTVINIISMSGNRFSDKSLSSFSKRLQKKDAISYSKLALLFYKADIPTFKQKLILLSSPNKYKSVN